MTSKAKIRQLEKEYSKATNIQDQRLVIRYITYQDKRPIDEHGFLLSKEEIRKLKSEDEEIKNMGGLVVYMTSYKEPKSKKI